MLTSEQKGQRLLMRQKAKTRLRRLECGELWCIIWWMRIPYLLQWLQRELMQHKQLCKNSQKGKISSFVKHEIVDGDHSQRIDTI